MITTWNVRGINKESRHREVSSYIHTLQVPIIALLETRIKETNADRIRRTFINKWAYIDNYTHHYNGRIWILWDDQEVTVKVLTVEEQFIHIDVQHRDNKRHYLATIVYALNQLEKRKILWEHIDRLGDSIHLPWIVIGDYNNVLTYKDRIGGNRVALNEYADLVDMMEKNGLFEAETKGSHFTWSNKHSFGAIYSRIDRLIGNSLWFSTYQDIIVEILPPHISDHSPIRVRTLAAQHRRKHTFKFLNCVTTRTGYHETVNNCWRQQVQGTPMQLLWHKMKKLSRTLTPLHREISGMRIQMLKTRAELEEAHKELQTNPFDSHLMELVKNKTDRLLELNQMEESMLKQKAKVEWLKLGDENNTFFHNSVRERHRHNNMNTLTSLNGSFLNNREDITKEIIEYYTTLLGTSSNALKGIDRHCILRGKILSRTDALSLIYPIAE
ncbi:uncharacterized protein LOC131650591 [Vicia villosa]|uniref:uncharacterized protein LOC131650591 n=1 Tax=Vicia villosa TaxID=3911 RepID=UPI00273AF021|nr:uncharacterized protein LOC131650591 [Vicia villosa]